MKTKLRNLKEDIKFNQLNMLSEILNEIDFVKNNSWGSDNVNFDKEKNSFTGALGSKVYFVGTDTLTAGDNGLFQRTEIELRQRLNAEEEQSLCRIYKTVGMERYMNRKGTKPSDLLVTVVTPDCFKNNGQSTKNTAFKMKHGLLSVKHTAQESVNGFINNLYHTVNDSIKDAVFENKKTANESKQILDFVIDQGQEL